MPYKRRPRHLTVSRAPSAAAQASKRPSYSPSAQRPALAVVTAEHLTHISTARSALRLARHALTTHTSLAWPGLRNCTARIYNSITVALRPRALCDHDTPALRFTTTHSWTGQSAFRCAWPWLAVTLRFAITITPRLANLH